MNQLLPTFGRDWFRRKPSEWNIWQGPGLATADRTTSVIGSTIGLIRLKLIISSRVEIQKGWVRFGFNFYPFSRLSVLVRGGKSPDPAKFPLSWTLRVKMEEAWKGEVNCWISRFVSTSVRILTWSTSWPCDRLPIPPLFFLADKCKISLVNSAINDTKHSTTHNISRLTTTLCKTPVPLELRHRSLLLFVCEHPGSNWHCSHPNIKVLRAVGCRFLSHHLTIPSENRPQPIVTGSVFYSFQVGSVWPLDAATPAQYSRYLFAHNNPDCYQVRSLVFL